MLWSEVEKLNCKSLVVAPFHDCGDGTKYSKHTTVTIIEYWLLLLLPIILTTLEKEKVRDVYAIVFYSSLCYGCVHSPHPSLVSAVRPVGTDTGSFGPLVFPYLHSTPTLVLYYRDMIIWRGTRYGAISWSSSPLLCASSDETLEKGR